MNNRESPWRPIELHHGPEEQAANLQSRIRDDRTSISSRQDLSLSNSSKERSNHASNSNLKTPPLRGRTEMNSKLSSKEFVDESCSQQNLQSLIRNQPCEPTHDTKLQSNYRGTCQWSQALLTSANSINRSSSSHSSERLQARMSPSSDAPSWDGVSVWVPNTSVSRNSRLSSTSKSPSFPRHQLSVTPRSTRFKVDVELPSLDSSNENIDQCSGHPSFLTRSQSQLPKNRGLSNCEIDRSPENYQLSRNTSLKSTPLTSTGLPTDRASDRFSSDRLQCRTGQVRGIGRQQMKKHNSLQQESRQSKVRAFSTLGRNESHPNRQLCPDFLKPLEVLRKKMELLEEQEMNVPNSDSGSSSGPGCHGTSRESVSSFLSFEETLDRALEEQNDFVDSQAFHSNRRHLHGVLENIEIPPISLGHQIDDLMAWRSNQQHFGDVRLSEEIAQNQDPFLPPLTSHKHKQAPNEPYSFVPNGQFLRLIEDTRRTEDSEEIAGVTQVVLNNQDNQNLNYFLKLHSSSKTQPASSENRLQNNVQQSTNPSSDKRLLNLHGILADIKKSIESSESKANPSASETGNQSNVGFHRNVQSRELNDSSSFVECAGNDKGGSKANECKKNILENFPTFHATTKTYANTDTNNKRDLHVVNKDSQIKSSPDSNEANEYNNSLERRDSYRKLSPEKIKEISAWAEKTVSGFRGGNGRTDEIRMKDLFFNKLPRHRKDASLLNRCSDNPTTREVVQSPRHEVSMPASNLPTSMANMTNSGTGNQFFDAAPLTQGHNARAVDSAPSRQSSSDKQPRVDKGLPCFSSLDTSTESSRDARMEAIEASLDDIFNEFLERTLLTKLPYIDDLITPSAPINESTSSLPAISSTHPSIHAPVISSLSTSNLKSPHSSALDCDNLEKGLTSLLSSHLKTASDQNLACSKPGSRYKGLSPYNSTSIFEQHLDFIQQQQHQQQHQQQQQNNTSVQLMAFKDELTLLRSRLMERIQCLESEHTIKTMRLENKCSHLEQVLVETFALTKTPTTGAIDDKNIATRASVAERADGSAAALGFLRERLTNIKKVVMTCDSGDAARPLVKSRKSKGQAPSSTGRKETMIDGSESESGEFVLHHRHHHHNHQQQHPPPPQQQHQRLSTHLATNNISGEVNRDHTDDDDEDGSGRCEEQEVYVIVLKDGITIEGIHATVPQGVNAPIKVHQQDLKDSFDAAFRALNDVIDSPSWTPSVSASDQRNQNMLGVCRRSQSQTSSSIRCSSGEQQQQLSKQQQQFTTTRDPFLLQQAQHQLRLNNNESLLYYHRHHHHHQQQHHHHHHHHQQDHNQQQQQQPQIPRDESGPQRQNISSLKQQQQRQYQQKQLQQQQHQQQQQQQQRSQSGRRFNQQTFPVPPDSWFSKDNDEEDVGDVDDPQT